MNINTSYVNLLGLRTRNYKRYLISAVCSFMLTAITIIPNVYASCENGTMCSYPGYICTANGVSSECQTTACAAGYASAACTMKVCTYGSPCS